ncbi:LacI family DNA-binding transcriptional regulator [Gracilibacillus sp. YIM 98692]|uniref:LacI family DNA-binding transcriptional regulator n=1 Tax=Gracilibacillus sp. YIM 98692 TaxID=2663532 RepID=UPI0013D8280B|nr:LacI family DNA-binding transcriptional regulator [Gracilibacillus sp. YIM 98692]
MKMEDVAREAGVSISTVSNVLTGKKPVSKALQIRVEAAIERLNYSVNPMASGLKSTKTNTLGVVLPNISRIFFPQVLKGIQDNARSNNFNLIYYDTDEELDKENKYIQELQNSLVDGIIIDFCHDINSDPKTKVLLESIINNNRKLVPIVALEKQVDSHYISSVSIDNKKSAYKATKHLMDQGHERIAHIAGPMTYPTTPQRLQGFKVALEEKGLFTEELVSTGDFRPLSGYRVTKSLLAKDEGMTAIFAANDQMAIGAMKALLEEGYRIPEDMAVIGFDNIFVSSIVSPSLTTIDVPQYQMGWEAVRKLHEQIKVQKVEKEDIVLPTQLRIRRSTYAQAEDFWELEGW